MGIVILRGYASEAAKLSGGETVRAGRGNQAWPFQDPITFSGEAGEPVRLKKREEIVLIACALAAGG